jgi:hypothetical protein
MITTTNGETTCECDECGCEEHSGTLEFFPFINQLKRYGWRITRDGETWCHTCPDCNQ